jgi:hypothetical protein
LVLASEFSLAFSLLKKKISLLFVACKTQNLDDSFLSRL